MCKFMNNINDEFSLPSFERIERIRSSLYGTVCGGVCKEEDITKGRSSTVGERGFELAVRKKRGRVEGKGKWGIDETFIPTYKTKGSAGADFMCAQSVVVPSIWSALEKSGGAVFTKELVEVLKSSPSSELILKHFKPTLVHTGIKAYMLEDEVLELYNRSGNPFKLGLVLANGVGVVDSDYYSCEDNDGEIMFAFYNFLPYDVKINRGERIGQGVFKKFLRPDKALVDSTVREGGFNSTGV